MLRGISMKTKAPFFAASYDTIKKSLYRFLILSLFCFSWIQSYAANTNNYHVLHNFAGPTADGALPFDSLILGRGVLYGMTEVGGGASNFGTIFSCNPDGSNYQILHDFAGPAAEGANPFGSLILDSGILYGMTELGGMSGNGTVFSYNISTTILTVLHDFAGGATDGAFPFGSLILDSGVLYGMTNFGGTPGAGIVFSCNTDGSNFRDLHVFAGGATDGAFPRGSLILDNGVLYGMTEFGGAFGGPSGNGIIFSCNTDGSNYQILHDFAGGATDGANPEGSLILDNGILYGMTNAGGAHNLGIIFSCNTDGSNFRDLHDFAGGATDGANPRGSLILDSGVLYGMTLKGGIGGPGGDGIIFSCNTDGSNFQDLHDFTGQPTDGAFPHGLLTLDSGVLYGMTTAGGIGPFGGNGIIFYLLGPVSTLTGHQLKNDFGIAFERFNKLTWPYPSPASVVQGYYVYRNGVRVAALNNATFTFEDHNIKKGVTTSYSVTSFDVFGNQSVPVTITIK